MDSETHVLFASRFLREINGDISAAIFSLLPALDREPPHQHRLILHSFFALPILMRQVNSRKTSCSDMSLRRTISLEPRLEKRRSSPAILLLEDYILKRLSHGIGERKWDKELHSRLARLNMDSAKYRINVALAFGTHLFLDTWNNPVQCFIPWTSACAFQWDCLSGEDYFVYRLRFYTEECIISFRKSLLGVDSWFNHQQDALTLLLGLLEYLADLSQPQLDTLMRKHCARLLLDQLGLYHNLSENAYENAAETGLTFWRSLASLITCSLKEVLGLTTAGGH